MTSQYCQLQVVMNLEYTYELVPSLLVKYTLILLKCKISEHDIIACKTKNSINKCSRHIYTLTLVLQSNVCSFLKRFILSNQVRTLAVFS